jgi:hypothetical protein
MMKMIVQRALSVKALPLVLVVAAIVRLATFPLVGAMNPHSWEYEWIANQMIQGHGYAFPWGLHNGINYIVPTAFMPPGQVMLDYLPLSIFGAGTFGHTVLFVEEFALSWLLVWVGYKLLLTLFKDTRIAILGAWLIALYPSFIITAASFGVSAAVLLLDAALLLAIARYFKAVEKGVSGMRAAIAFGALAGLLTFFRSEAYGVLTVTTLFLAWKFRRQLRGRTKEAVVVAITAFIVVSPWIIRNYVTLDKLVIGSTSGGFNFWRGHNADATGSSWKADGNAVWTTEEMNRAFDAEVKVDPNIEQHYADFHVRRALQWITQHPTDEVLVDLKKPLLLWGIDWYSEKAKTAGYILLYALTAALAILGVRQLRSFDRSLPLVAAKSAIVLWLALYTVVVIAFFSLPRLQVILIGIYFPIVVLGAQRVLDRFGFWENSAVTSTRTAPVVATMSSV